MGCCSSSLRSNIQEEEEQSANEQLINNNNGIGGDGKRGGDAQGYSSDMFDTQRDNDEENMRKEYLERQKKRLNMIVRQTSDQLLNIQSLDQQSSSSSSQQLQSPSLLLSQQQSQGGGSNINGDQGDSYRDMLKHKSSLYKKRLSQVDASKQSSSSSPFAATPQLIRSKSGKKYSSMASSFSNQDFEQSTNAQL
ncbi:hypothetical protein MP228_001929 [Amoeboaphelidium protococcarum]|nr:hypothetical protein MP228_001929 [Amoeboaphelidium protococcarum]